jgi:hypothetical protein
MFDIAPDHAIALFAGLLAIPFALAAVRLRPPGRSVTGTVRAACVLMFVVGAIHMGLVPSHLGEPVTAWLFVADGVTYIALSLLSNWRWWRPASAALVATSLVGYIAYIAIGLDSPDQVSIATKLLELVTLGLVLVPVRSEQATARRALRWTALGIAVPVLMVATTASVWIVDLARPDARHAHAGAILQPTNQVATPDQVAAAAALLAETKAAIAPYQDWHVAWAAGYRPGGPGNMPSTHWMNQRYVDAGYVLDPNRPQGLVYANTRHGPVLLGAMFQMKHLGQFGPDPGGPLTAWHQHQDICFTPLGFEFSLMTPTATCPLGSFDISAPPMLHVWVVANPKGGPFAVDIDEHVVKAIDNA